MNTNLPPLACSRALSSSPCRLWQDGGTGLFMAALDGHEAVVRLLLEHKASVDAAAQVVTRML